MKAQEKAPARAENTEPGNNQEQPKTTRKSSKEQSRRFEESILAALRIRLPDYLARHGVELIKRGSRLVGHCPAHDDRIPSFAIFGNRLETCGCFPCGFTGDVFAVSHWLGRSTTFPDAVQDVAGALGVHLPQPVANPAARQVTASARPAKQAEPPFVLSAADREKSHAARLAFSDAFHSGDPVIDRIAASLGLDRETLRLASWGSSGLGLAAGSYGKPVWLCYAYPQGLKWRNPDPSAKPRFEWLAGKALAPWRMEWVKPDIRTVYVTEGESDCMALIAAGLEADEIAACVASPGTSFPREWAKLFTGKHVVLCFDHDEPGRKATATVAAILKGHAAELLTWKEQARNV
jgi:DNA primase